MQTTLYVRQISLEIRDGENVFAVSVMPFDRSVPVRTKLNRTAAIAWLRGRLTKILPNVRMVRLASITGVV